jgi:hypothetical protein
LRSGQTRQVRRCFGNGVDVLASVDEDVDIAHRQVDALRASRCCADEPVPQPRIDSLDQVEAGAQHRVQFVPVAQRPSFDPIHGRQEPAGSDMVCGAE